MYSCNGNCLSSCIRYILAAPWRIRTMHMHANHVLRYPAMICNRSNISSLFYTTMPVATYNLRIFDCSLCAKDSDCCLTSLENFSFVAFLSDRRVWRSAFTACLRIFLSPLDSFFERAMVTRGGSGSNVHGCYQIDKVFRLTSIDILFVY